MECLDYIMITSSKDMPRQSNQQIGRINLAMKLIGKPGAGKLHAGFDEAGDWR